MCRFLIIKSIEKQKPEASLNDFADLCEKSIAPNGDRQEDGWGAAWFDEKLGWQNIKSLAPIWNDKDKFADIPATKMLVVHARSATHAKEKGSVTFNQPFTGEGYCFVFNGALKGVSIKRPIPGEIGSQKIWSLLKEYLQTDPPAKALAKLKRFLDEHTKQIIALNVGIITKDSASVLCQYGQDKEYYTVHYKDNSIVCSEIYNTDKIIENTQIITI